MFTNDLFKDGKIINDKSRFFKTSIGDNVVIGSNSTILPVKYHQILLLEPAQLLQKI